MKKIIALALAALIFSPGICLSQNEEATMTRPWFNTEECNSLDIRKYQSISVHQIVSQIAINDSQFVKSIMERIRKIPANGDKMISFGADAESVDLIFHCANGTTQNVEIYQRRFKTPSTGFNSEINEAEALLYSDIDSLLYPDLGKRILKIKNTPFRFKNFSLTYLGAKQSEPAPVTASWTTDQFMLKDNNDREQIIGITSGQLSPQPCHFDIGNNGYSLLTYQTEMKERLYPGYFQVVKRNR